MDRRFPGIEWYCDRCGAYLNDQEGFDDHHHFWKCRVCGYKNPIGIEEIYDSEEDYKNHIPTDRDMFFKALRERTEELEGTDPPGNE
ncbi:MAG: Sec23/Sec24 zinc finger-containing protein [Lachnospiraceae bacterium]|nr:Sec23/Sec24 zinc finger-containing protein [Lachnospiraceae bacterium]